MKSKVNPRDIRSGPMSDFPNIQFHSARFADYGGATREQDVQEAIQVKYYSKKIVEALFERVIVARIAEDITQEASHPAQGLYAYKEVELSGSGVTSDASALEGSEERMDLDQIAFTAEMLDHAVVFTRNALFLPVINLREIGRKLLQKWFDEIVEGKLLTSSANGVGKVFYGGNATAPANIDATDTLTPTNIKKAYFYLLTKKVPGFTLAEIKQWFGPEASNIAKKTAYNPRDGYYVAVLHPGQIYDITATAEWITAAGNAATATVQGVLGPQFEGNIYLWHNVILVSSTLVGYDAWDGYSVDVARGFVYGRGALAFGFQKLQGGAMKTSGLDWQEAGFDYNRLEGTAILTRFAQGVLDNEKFVAEYSALSAAAQDACGV